MAESPAVRPHHIIAKRGAALCIYAAMALLLFAQHARWRDELLGAGADPVSFVWFLSWWPNATLHGQNPFVTDYVWHPNGFNLVWATSVPTLAFLLAPLSHALGPVFSFNLLTVAAPALAAWTCFLLCEEVTQNWAASLLGGYLFGFSAYETGQMLGHLNLDFICLVPLVVLLGVKRVRSRLSRRGFVAGLAVCLVAQLGISTEILLSLCLFAALSWVVFFTFAAKPERAPLWRLAGDVALAGLLTLLLASPFLYALLRGAGDVQTQLNAVQDYVTDPRNLLIPTVLMRFTTPYLLGISRSFAGNLSEQGSYFGLPLLVLLGWFFIRAWRAPGVKPLCMLTLLLLLCSLGPRLQTGAKPSDILLPWRLVEHLPLLGKLLPARFSMYVALAAGLATAMMLAQLRGIRRGMGFMLALAACASLLPQPALVRWEPWPQNPYFSRTNIEARLGKMPNLLILPYGMAGPGLAWQLNARMSFTQTGGYIGFLPVNEQAYPVFNALQMGSAPPGFINALKFLCATHGINFILMGPDTPPAQAQAILAQNWQTTTVYGVTQVKLPARLDYVAVSGNYWDGLAPANWMGQAITITNRGAARQLILHAPAQMKLTDLRMSVATQGQNIAYPLASGEALTLTLAADSTTQITASRTWTPGGALAQNPVSVLVEIQPP